MENAKVKIFRYAEPMASPQYSTYEVPREKGLSVLQALFWIKDHYDDAPAFRRYQCNRGQCCSCLMTINGEIKRACTTAVEAELVLEPLQDYPIIRDLIVDFGKIVDGRLVRKGVFLKWPKAVWRVDRGQKQVIVFHDEKCTLCEICQNVCPVNRYHNLRDESGGRRESPVLFRSHNGVLDLQAVCSQCSNAPCRHFCPAQVISRDKITGAIVVAKEHCIGCGMCITACPNNAIFLDAERGKAIKCELCGGDPLCVKNCPTAALEAVPCLEVVRSEPVY